MSRSLPLLRFARTLAETPSEGVDFVDNPRARRITMRIDPVRRKAVVSVPPGASRRDAERFCGQHAAWLAAELAALPDARPFAEGARVPLRGEDHELARPSERGPGRILDATPPIIAVPALPDMFASRVKRFLIAQAREDLTSAAHDYAETLGVSIRRITMKDTATRWGSCTADGALNFSWRLVCAPPQVLDYVAAHEVAHFIERNHGPRFWRLVDRLFGDCADEREWLLNHGKDLFAVGSDV